MEELENRQLRAAFYSEDQGTMLSRSRKEAASAFWMCDSDAKDLAPGGDLLPARLDEEENKLCAG